MNESAKIISKVRRLYKLTLENDLKVTGELPTGESVSVECRNFGFDSGSHNTPLNFSLHIRVNGVIASRWDFCFFQDQKDFQFEWVRLVRDLRENQYLIEDNERETATKTWEQF